MEKLNDTISPKLWNGLLSLSKNLHVDTKTLPQLSEEDVYPSFSTPSNLQIIRNLRVRGQDVILHAACRPFGSSLNQCWAKGLNV